MFETMYKVAMRPPNSEARCRSQGPPRHKDVGSLKSEQTSHMEQLALFLQLVISKGINDD